MKLYRGFLISLFLTSIAGLTFPYNGFGQTVSCNYYASPTGTGDGRSQSTPFKLSNFWAVAKPGQTLCLLDGIYTGASSMIMPPSGLSGTSPTARITIAALNEGKVLIDGQYARIPILLSNNDWFIIEGVNACCHDLSNNSVVYVAGSDNDIIRRVVAWNANPNSAGYVFITNTATNILFEDVAGFGTGRIIMGSYKSNHVTYRRAFAQWMQGKNVDPSGGPQSPMQMDYDSINDTWENVIGTTNWTGAGATQFNGGAIGIHSGTSWGDDKLFGSIFYTTAGQNVSYQGNMFITDWCQPGVHPGCTPYWTDPWGGTHTEHGPVTLKDVVFYSAQGKIPIQTLDRGACSGSGCSIINATTISTTPNSIDGPWSSTNLHHYSTLSAMNSASANPFQSSTGTGARVCKQYVGGTLTNTPLWPWPMNQRIIDAMKTAGKTPVDVTATMEQIFGPIPAECRTSGQIATSPPVIIIPTAPINLQATR